MKKLEWHTEKRIIEDLLPYDKNPRKLSTEKLDLLKKSIEKYGFVEIPVIDIDNVILAGHQRLKAMQILGRGKEETDVRVPNRKLTESEFKEYNIQSNVAMGEWDIDTLLEDFNDIDLPDLGVEIDDLEFQLSDEFEVSKERFIEMKNIKAEDEAEEPDLAVPEVAKSVKGDIYELISEDKDLKHRVMCGDSTIEEDVEKLMDGQKAGMVFTDPPYGIDYSGGRTQTIKKVEYGKIKGDKSRDISLFIKQIIKNGFINDCYICCSPINLKPVINNIEKYEGVIVWKKNRPGLGFGFIRRYCEFIIFLTNRNAQKEEKSEFDFWEISTTKEYVHGSQKPIELIERGISFSSKQNEIVCDWFLGSGSTLIACEKTKRICYGMELDEYYCDVIVKRWANYMKDNNLNFKIKRNGKIYDYDTNK